jgi:hypothetical protein
VIITAPGNQSRHRLLAKHGDALTAAAAATSLLPLKCESVNLAVSKDTARR